MISPVPSGRRRAAHKRPIFEIPAENAGIADWVAERSHFELAGDFVRRLRNNDCLKNSARQKKGPSVRALDPSLRLSALLLGFDLLVAGRGPVAFAEALPAPPIAALDEAGARSAEPQ